MRVPKRNPHAVVLAAVISLTMSLACSVYDSSLLGSGSAANGADRNEPLNLAGMSGTASSPDGGAATAAGGASSEYGSSGDHGVSDAGSSIGGTFQEPGGMSTGGGNVAAGEANGGATNNGGRGGGGNGGNGGNGGRTGMLRELAKGKSVAASTQQTKNAAAQANDGDTTTRWAASNGSFPQWWRVDLGATHQVVQVSISFEHPERTYNYVIETSMDDTVYAQQVMANGTGVTQKLALPDNVTARYVRVTVTNGIPPAVNGIGTWASFWECSMLGY